MLQHKFGAFPVGSIVNSRPLKFTSTFTTALDNEKPSSDKIYKLNTLIGSFKD